MYKKLHSWEYCWSVAYAMDNGDFDHSIPSQPIWYSDSKKVRFRLLRYSSIFITFTMDSFPQK